MIPLLALAQILVCSDVSCGSTTGKDAANVQANDLVKYCAASTPDRSTACTNVQIIPWHSMNSYSRVLTDDGYWRVSDVPSGSPPSTPTSPTPPIITPPTVTPIYDIVLSWQCATDSATGACVPATGFHLYYNLVGAQPTMLSVGNIFAYTITAPPAGNYEIRISATTASGETGISNPALVTISAPSAPVTPPPTQAKITETPGTWTLKQGSSNVQTGLASYDACKALAASKATTTPTKYLCNVSDTLVVSK